MGNKSTLNRRPATLLGVLAFASCLGLAACGNTRPVGGDQATTPPTVQGSPQAAVTSPAGTLPKGEHYLIGPGDLLKVEVFRIKNLTREVRVNANGEIALPLIGLVQAAGLTAEQLAADIAERLSKDYLQNPEVIVFVQEHVSQRITVVGAVSKPDVIPMKGRTTLMQVIAAAGGPTSVARTGSVKILRAEPDGTRKMLEYDLGKIRAGELPDPELRGEDIVQIDTNVVKGTVKQVSEFLLPFWVIGSIL